MRSTSTADRPGDVRHGVRRAALHSALRAGDDLAAARAASRLRVHAGAVSSEEMAMARASRARVGHAIREARWRRRMEDPVASFTVERVTVAPVPATLSGKWPVQSISEGLAFVALVALLLGLLVPRAAAPEEPAPAAAAPPEVIPVVHVVETVSGRGRTTVAVSIQSEPTPSPTPVPTATPAPTAEPTVAPTVAARRTSAPVAAASPAPGGQPSGAPGGVPGGQPGGVPGGVPGGTGTAAPKPTLKAPLFATPAPTGWTRIMFTVSDGITGAPLADVCVLIATASCEVNQRFTNGFGQWWLDLPPDAAVLWNIRFVHEKFTSASISVTHVPGRNIEIPIKIYQVRS